MKVGKEEIAGLVRAVELYVAQDHDAVYEQWRDQLTVVERALADLPGVATERVETSWSEGIPATRVTVDAAVAEMTAEQVAEALRDGEPGIRVAADSASLTVVPQFLEKGDERIIAERLREILRVPVEAR
jgi:L-seryl-tRNA(Ser) seleniumtransferase